MNLFGHHIFGGAAFKQRFTGNWSARLSDLFDSGIDYRDKTILDVGCNIGVVAYEISKARPGFIHGIDNYRPAVKIARTIFRAVPIKSQFDTVELTNTRKVDKILRPGYDIVLFLSVWKDLRREKGEAAAGRVVEALAAHCHETFVVRVMPDFADGPSSTLRGVGFHLGFDGEQRDKAAGKIMVFHRSASAPLGPPEA